jgi:hypothetical protein
VYIRKSDGKDVTDSLKKYIDGLLERVKLEPAIQRALNDSKHENDFQTALFFVALATALYKIQTDKRTSYYFTYHYWRRDEQTEFNRFRAQVLQRLRDLLPHLQDVPVPYNWYTNSEVMRILNRSIDDEHPLIIPQYYIMDPSARLEREGMVRDEYSTTV